MTGRAFNDRYQGQAQRGIPRSKRASGSSYSGGLTPRDTGYIITPDDATEKATSNLDDASRLLTDYGDMMLASERSDLEQIIAGQGQPQEMGLKEGAMVALGRLGETIDRPFQLIRHTIAAAGHPDIGLSGRDFVDIMSGHDERLVDRYGEDLVGVHGDMSGSQILRLMGVDEADTTGGKVARFAGAMVIETIFDPTTWFTGGFSGLGKKAALEAMQKSVTASADNVLMTLTRKTGGEMLTGTADDMLKKIDDVARAGYSRLDNRIYEE
ncbi:MAG: hypothetical protein M3094_02710, partial [Actinomycetia bacterium]|nr:hypothetical protein [Actinomycetes bacterium]